MAEFWTLIEQARVDASEDNDAWPSGSAIGVALADNLMQMLADLLVGSLRLPKGIQAAGHDALAAQDLEGAGGVNIVEPDGPEQLLVGRQRRMGVQACGSAGDPGLGEQPAGLL